MWAHWRFGCGSEGREEGPHQHGGAPNLDLHVVDAGRQRVANYLHAPECVSILFYTSVSIFKLLQMRNIAAPYLYVALCS